MLNKNMSRSEIEKELKGKGDFVQIDYLTKFIEQKPPLHEKKFAYTKLIEIYEAKKMFNDIARIYESLAVIALSVPEKVGYFMKEAEYYVLAGYFDRADSAMRKAMENSPMVNRPEIYSKIKNFYIKTAQIHEKDARRNHAIKIYEKMLIMKISDSERSEIKEKLLKLYEQLGKFREFSNLEGRRA